MKLAITPRFFENNTEQLISIEKKYFPFFRKFNHHLNLIPYLGIDIDKFFDDLSPDAVVFAGGYRLYTDEIKEFETRVLKEALKKNLPILAICCGMWTVNYFFNGSLRFDESHQAFDGKKINMSKLIHNVHATDYIKQDKYKVNSFHSKVIDKLGDGLKSFLVADDNTIEGIYDLKNKILGIQFHMENKGVSDSLTNQIMEKFENL